MHLAQHIQFIAARHVAEIQQLRIRKDGRYQQDGIGAVRARLEDLKLVHNKILAQAGQAVHR